MNPVNQLCVVTVGISDRVFNFTFPEFPNKHRRSWSHDEIHEVAGIVGWWYCNLKGWDGFYVKVTEEGEETLFRRPGDEDELEMVDLLQFAPHVHGFPYRRDPMMKFAEVLQTAQNPAPFLEHLSISTGMHIPATRFVFESIASNKLRRLTYLHLSGEGLDDEGYELLGAAAESGYISALKTLDLRNCNTVIRHRILAKAMESGAMLALEELHLDAAKMRDTDCAAYAAAISVGKLPCLAKLNFSRNRTGSSGAQALGRAMRLGELKHLELQNSGITDEGLNAFADSLQAGGDGGRLNLKFLDLANNPFTEVGLRSLAKAFASGRLNFLKHLDLSKFFIHNIGDDRLNALADSFQAGGDSVLPNLKFVNLSYTFTDVGVRSLAKAISSGCLRSLETLELHYTAPISKEAATTLVSALSNLKNLTEVVSDWGHYPNVDRLQNQIIERNLRLRAIFKGLEGSPVVPATYSKVYVCGDPEVGKTTLRKTLQRSFYKSLLRRERKPHVEKRTRGIDVSLIASYGNTRGENPISLYIWDMAGQNEYHLLHNALFLDLSSAKGKATTFIIVCSSEANLQESKQQLIYWLRFIASSCANITGNLRRVLVVVNNIGGDPNVMAVKPNWKEFIVHQRGVFKDYLDIHVDPFIVDVRKYKSVQNLKKSLLDHARHSPRDETVPEICQFVEKDLQAWSKARMNFPVLEWKQFVKEVHEQSKELWAEQKLEAATRYLDEAGVLVYINVPSDLGTPHRRLVVINPNWFCNEIAGKIFLHEDMVSPKERLFRKYVDHDGSISITEFKEFFKYSLSAEWNDLDFEDLIVILLMLGLCYQGREHRLYVPALIAEKGYPVWDRNHTEHQWVMGFIVEHQESATALAPIALWHRLQVELAQSSRFNGSQDNAFRIGRYFITFSVDYMNVLMEVSVDQGSPTFDNISIFVKPLLKDDDLDGVERKQCQVDLAMELVEILLGKVWNKVCPGVE